MTTDLRSVRRILTLHEGTGPFTEGRYFPYVDTVGKVTIGVGRNLTDCGISSAEKDVLLANDIDAVIQDLETFPWFPTLNAARQVAIIDLAFNLGTTGFRKWTGTIGYLERGDYVGAARHFRSNRKYFGQVGARADWIATVIETGTLHEGVLV